MATRSHPYSRPRREAATTSSAPLSKCIVSGLHYEITEQELVKIFKPYGSFARDPAIRYDRSGRSTGFAFVTYENEEDAAVAQKELDGVLAKGEEIHVKLDHYYAPRGAKDKANGPATSAKGGRGGSLLNRIEKDSLLNRLSDKSSGKDASKAAAPKTDRAGPARSERPANGRTRSERGVGSRQSARRQKPKTAEDLDKELDAYTKTAEDVDMAA
ncbi:hypothetical protein M407DRAFT_241785 [Tulasnella calospora MUT 4182]|uniref:RRM domain-containing protein n=1 Tax=Tulasnella calospora MUT 4182 TaxID=1051891 RepID=A0A0C3QTB3_9AGAM|nr:hypothetical protein M407DRAFT_241785 [Tulasnella calospora MUT 4182]